MSLVVVAVPSFDRCFEQILFLFYISFVRGHFTGLRGHYLLIEVIPLVSRWIPYGTVFHSTGQIFGPARRDTGLRDGLTGPAGLTRGRVRLHLAGTVQAMRT